MHRAFARWLSVAFDYFDLLFVDVRQHLGQVAHVEQRPSDRTVPEMIGFGFGHAIRIDAGIARDHKSSPMPLKNGWRTLPSADVARYSISASNEGSTQLGDLLCQSAFNFLHAE
jgi:hypothetical protein